LLTLPFQQSFSSLTTSEQTAFYVAFFGSATASILLIAPSAHQRIRAPRSGVHRRSREHLLFTVRMTIVGTVIFAIALGAAVFLVTSIVLEQAAAAIGTAIVAALVAWAWFYVPMVRFREPDSR
jgi:uncharacterized membrane protein